MTPLRRLIGLVLLSAAAAGAVFAVKYQVQTLEGRLAALQRDIQEDQRAVHVLQAEWSYLNEPARLAELSQRYLELQAVDSAQVAEMDAVPFRLAAPPLPPALTSPASTAPGKHKPATSGGTFKEAGIGAKPAAKPATRSGATAATEAALIVPYPSARTQ